MKKILLLLLVSVAAMVSFASAQYDMQDNSGASGASYSPDMCKDKTSEKCCVVESCDKCNEKYTFDGICDKCGEKCHAYEYCPKCHKTYATYNPDGRCDFCGSDCYGWEMCDKCGYTHYFDGYCDKCGDKCNFNRACEKCVTVCCESEQPMTFEKEEKQCIVVCQDNKKVDEKKPTEVQLEIKKPEEKKPMEHGDKCKSMMPCKSGYGNYDNYGGYMMGGRMGYSAY